MDIMFNMHGVSIESLPPGTQHRHVFNRSSMGLEMMSGGGGGGGSSGPDWEEIADKQHEQAMNSYNYDWDNTQRQYNHMLLQNEIQRHDQAEQYIYQRDSAEQQWMYATAQQEQEYNAKVAAFNKSEKMYGTQVQMHQIAATKAIEEQTAQTNERFQELQFAVYKEGLDYQTKKTELAQKGASVDLDIYSKRTAADRQKQQLTIQEQTKRGVSALQSQDTAVQGMQALGKVKARGQAGRSAEKQYQSISAQISRVQAAKAFELNRSDLAYRLAMNGVDATMAEQQAGAELARAQIGASGASLEAGYALAKDQQDATALSIRGAHGRAVDKIHHQQYASNLEADYNRMSQPTMGIPIPAPLDIPQATIMDPLIPVRGEPPVWGAGGGAGPSSAGSTGGGGAVSSAMTGLGLAATQLPVVGSSAAMAAGFSVSAAVPIIGWAAAAFGIIGGAAGWF